MDLEQMELTPFVSEELPKKRTCPSPSNGTRKSSARTKRSSQKNDPTRVTSMLLKIGICAGACLLVLILKWINTPLTNQALKGVQSAISEETDFDELLGKLQFVSLPGIAEVFSSNDKFSMPVTASSYSLEKDDHIVTWNDIPLAEVSAVASGQVKAIGEDKVLGRYVRLSHSGDLETIYYGFEQIQVEEGQPIRRMDTLGTLGQQGNLHLLVLLEGRPQEPEKYFDLSSDQQA